MPQTMDAMYLCTLLRMTLQRPSAVLLPCLLGALLACLSACGGGFNHDELPLLPPKNWLDPTSEEQVAGNTVKLSTDKKHPTFIDLVYWAVQESPAINRSSINLDLQQISLSDTKWMYLPEIRAILTISNNITQYNKGLEKEPRYYRTMRNYGEMAYRVLFSGSFNNPITTYFSVRAQEELMNIAIETHKKAIEICITDIAMVMVQMISKQESVELMQKYVELLHKHARYAQKANKFNAQIWTQAVNPEDRARDMELQLETAKMELTILRNRLKLLVGLDRDKRLDVELRSIEKELRAFDPAGYTWEQCWKNSTARYLLQQQVRLHDAGILLAWAQYAPNIGLNINESPPRGQAQPGNAETDEFLHITFNFPLLDWGHRYRGAATSRAKKRQSMLDVVIKEQEYRNDWFTVADKLTLHQSRLKQRELAVEHAQRRVKALTVAFENGQATFPEVVAAHQILHDARMAVIAAREELHKTQLAWMNLAQFFRNKFLQNSVKGK